MDNPGHDAEAMAPGLRMLSSGERLCVQGDNDDEVYLVVHGELEAVHLDGDQRTVLGRIGPGEVVGEIAALVGGTRTATVTAVIDTAVRRIAHDDVDVDQLRVAARQRMHESTVVKALAELFGTGAQRTGLDDRVVAEVLDVVDWIELPVGDVLYRQGDPADAAYIVVAGQISVEVESAAGTVYDTRLNRGSLLGQIGLIKGEPRMATARVTRACTVAVLSTSAFALISREHPEMLLQVTRNVLSMIDRGRERHTGGPLTVGLVVAAPLDPAVVVDVMHAEMRRHATCAVLDAPAVDRRFNSTGATEAPRGTPLEMAVDEFVHEVATNNHTVLLAAAADGSDWCRRVLQTADRVVLVASERPDEAERAAIAHAYEAVDFDAADETWIGVVGSSDPRRRRLPVRVAQGVEAKRIVHLGAGDPPELRRLARLATGNGVGLALSGGGARAMAQVGALDVFGDLGFEFDAVAGTSMGSVVAGMFSLDGRADRLAAIAVRELDDADLFDYTLPLTSFMQGRKLTDRLQRVFGGLKIEHGVVPLTCVSANLSRASVHDHVDGDLAQALRASVSLPGVFPPVVHDGDYLVDGGILENLPVRPLTRDPGIGTIVAIDVAPPTGFRPTSDYGHAVSGFDVARNRLRRRLDTHPSVATTLMTSMLVSSSRARRGLLERSQVDLYLSLHLPDVGLFDFSEVRRTIDHGRRESVDRINEWVEAYRSERGANR